MIPVPKLDKIDIAFGNIDHMPAYEDVPDEFKNDDNPYAKFVSRWFFSGVDAKDIHTKPGVNRRQAIAAIKSILMSFDPKQEHKIAGAAYLYSQWFEQP